MHDLDPLIQQAEERIRTYTNLYNDLERALRTALGVRPAAKERRYGLGALSREYGKAHTWWQARDPIVQTHVEMRAFLTHERGVDRTLLAVPLDPAIESLQALLNAVKKPTRVMPLFKRDVVTVTLRDPVRTILDHARTQAITYFPVFDGNTFLGVVTGNGVIHWLARERERLSLIDLDDITIADLLPHEEDAAAKVRFIDKRMMIQDAFDLMSADPMVEILLITDAGKEGETLLGIVTPSDVAVHVRTV